MNDPRELWLRLLVTGILIAVNALYVFHEFAYVALKPGQIRRLDKDRSRVGRLVSRAAHRLDHYIAVDQLGITASSIAVGWVGQPVVSQVFAAVFGDLGLSAGVLTTISAMVAFALLTGTQMVCGELIPKSYALRHPERTARATALPVELTARIFHPFVVLLNGIGLAAVRLLGFRGTGERHHPTLPAEELVGMVQSSAQAGLLPADPKVLSRLLNFSDLRARDLMVPRPDVVTIGAGATFADVLATARAHRHDRYPVFQGSPDQIVGMVNVKDLLAASARSSPPQQANWQRWVQAIPTLPETASVETLLVTLDRTQKEMALLVDEFATPAGIVTITDIAEQLIAGPDEIRAEASESYLVDGHASIVIVEAELGISLPAPLHSTVDTIAGLIFDALGRIPTPGETIRVHGHVLEVVDMDDHRITTVRLRIGQDDAGADLGAG